MKENWAYRKVKEVCDKASSNIVLNKIENNVGDYALYGASGFVKGVDFFHREESYIGIVKDGSGVGRVDVFPAKSSLVGTMQYILPKKDCLLKYFCYALQSLKLADFVTGAAIPHIYFRDYGECVIPVPPLAIQSRIVSELDLLQSIIDKQKTQLKELDNLAQAIFYDMFGDPVENEKGWEVKKLGEITNKISDGVHAKPNYTETGMPFISVVNINRGKLIFDDCKYVSQIDGETFNKRTKPEKGDILYTKVGATYGISALVDVDIDFCLYVSVCLIKPKRELLDSLFLTHMMRLPYIKNQADERIRGIGVPDLHLNQISAFDVIVPPLSLQQTFAQKIESIERQKELINQSIREARALFDSRMEYYFGV